MRSKIRLAFIITQFLVCLAFLFAALIPYIDPSQFTLIAFIGILYFYLLLTVLLFLIISVLIKTKWFFLPLVTLILNFQQIRVVFAFNFFSDFKNEKNDDHLRILSWNVSWWTESEYSSGNYQDNSFRNLMMDLVEIQNADILCFQEFFECSNPVLYPSNISHLKKLGYEYYLFSPSLFMRDSTLLFGLAVFSKKPFTNTFFDNSIPGQNSEGFQFADIEFSGKKLRIFNTHLESPQFDRKEYTEAGIDFDSKNIYNRLENGYAIRKKQVDFLSYHLRQSTFPSILCGDLNDIPNSYTYFNLKNEMQDAFIKQGSGLGRSFRFILPTLRIDYIFADNNFSVEQFTRLRYDYSDHYALVTDLKINSD